MEETSKKHRMPDDEEISDLAELFKVFGDATRLKILLSIYDGEKSVNEIAEEVGMSTSAVSHQLKILRTAKLAAVRRDGKQIFYSLADDHVHTIIGVGRDHVNEPD